MAKYTIEDTDEGYRLTLDGRTLKYAIDEKGGHGPIESLYDQTEKLWLEMRQGNRQDRARG